MGKEIGLKAVACVMYIRTKNAKNCKIRTRRHRWRDGSSAPVGMKGKRVDGQECPSYSRVATSRRTAESGAVYVGSKNAATGCLSTDEWTRQ